MVRAPADVRLARLLDIVPWIASRDGPALAEVSERFGISEDELVAELNLLFMCGLHPFTPDVLIDVDIADGRVWIRMADYFRRPLRLSPQEGLALESAARAFLNLRGTEPDGALASALAKLETVLGVAPDEALEVELGYAAPDLLESLRHAATHSHKMLLDYYSFGRDGRSERVVRPWNVFSSSGHWYMRGWCERVGDERLFRVDRIIAARELEERFEPPTGTGDPDSRIFDPQPGDPVVVLDLDPPARWIAEQYPNDEVSELPGGVIRVKLRAGRSAWLERVLLKAGPDARVVEGPADLAPAAAERILARYRG
ncbi:MAG TPA: WYL domain-containing protein [Acidimicrobiales bacterium]|nr:WYL domain-containing protein [Acidimicrobiales bacterium]